MSDTPPEPTEPDPGDAAPVGDPVVPEPQPTPSADAVPPTPPEGWVETTIEVWVPDELDSDPIPPEGRPAETPVAEVWVPDELDSDPIPPEGRAASASTAPTDNEADGGDDTSSSDQTASTGEPTP